MGQRLDSKPIPFVSPPEQRNLGTEDSRYVNVLFEPIANPLLQQKTVYCIKRWGVSSFQSPGISTGRGIHSWGLTGSTYSVVGNSIFSDTSTLTSSMNTSSGRCWFVEIPPSTGQPQLVICDGQDNYNITSSGVLTQIDQGDDAQYPVSTLGPVVYLDGYLFQGASSGRIYNTELNSLTSWLANDFITADTHAGPLEAIYIQKDQIAAFTKNRVEFFFNNGNPTGSPLLRIDQNTMGIGLASRESLAWSGETACFVGENSGDGDGGRAVYIMQSLSKVRDISTPVINRVLANEGVSISSCTAFMERLSGQLVYGLDLKVADRTYLYGVDSGMWSEAESSTSTRLNISGATSRNGTIYLQDSGTGTIYQASPNLFQDNLTDFTVTLQTPRMNWGTPLRKYEPSLSIVGDSTLSTVQVYVNDDDSTSTYNLLGQIDMTKPQKRITRLGGFYDRAHRFEYQAASSFRVQAWAPEINK